MLRGGSAVCTLPGVGVVLRRRGCPVQYGGGTADEMRAAVTAEGYGKSASGSGISEQEARAVLGGG